jgi:hypothetical protein
MTITYEEVANFISHQRNANKSHSEIPLPILLEWAVI